MGFVILLMAGILTTVQGGFSAPAPEQAARKRHGHQHRDRRRAR